MQNHLEVHFTCSNKGQMHLFQDYFAYFYITFCSVGVQIKTTAQHTKTISNFNKYIYSYGTHAYFSLCSMAIFSVAFFSVVVCILRVYVWEGMNCLTFISSP